MIFRQKLPPERIFIIGNEFMQKSTLPLNWAERARLDGITTADIVRNAQIAWQEPATQATCAADLLDGQLNARLVRFEDAGTGSTAIGSDSKGYLYGGPALIKDPGDGLPLAVQFLGDWGREDALLQLTAPVEQARLERFPLHHPCMSRWRVDPIQTLVSDETRKHGC